MKRSTVLKTSKRIETLLIKTHVSPPMQMSRMGLASVSSSKVYGEARSQPGSLASIR